MFQRLVAEAKQVRRGRGVGSDEWWPAVLPCTCLDKGREGLG